MKWLLRMFAAAAVLVLVGCSYREREIETGYKGPARSNAWLAAERFAERYDYPVRSLARWTEPDWDDAVWLVPAAVLNNVTFCSSAADWIDSGGHLILVVEHAEAHTNDWASQFPGLQPDFPPALVDLLNQSRIHLEADRSASAEAIEFDNTSYVVAANSLASVAVCGGAPGVFASVPRGEGRLTVITDGRIFRNRWIGENDHAVLFHDLLFATEVDGAVVFVRGAAMSFWELLGERLWPLLVGLAMVTGLWLWKNLRRFGPMEPLTEPSPLRAYDHHLEALGSFQWRLDHAKALLLPLRELIIERGQRLGVRAGQRDDDFFAWLGQRAGLPRERVFRALAEPAPADTAVLARTTADLQRLLQSLD
jgi:hypothetical protein